MVLTSTSGGPTSAAIRSTTPLDHGWVGRVAHLVPDAVGQLLERVLVAVDADDREPGVGKVLRRRAAAWIVPGRGERNIIAEP
jgi:hypothetical protein